MFATDRGWLARMTEAVRSGLTAEAAVQKVRDETKSRLMQVTDPYLRERLYDLEDLANRLQQYLVGPPAGAGAAECPTEFILVAEAMGPAELLDYAHRRIKGLVLEEGSPTMHVAIVARALDIPVVGRVAERDPRHRAGRRRRRRRRQRQRADPSARRHPAIGRGGGRGAHAAPRLLRDACATSRP